MSSSHERKVDAYLKPTNHKMVTNYASEQKISQSKAVNDLLDKIPEQVKSQILKTKELK